jgi:hypothetical protein
MLPLTALTYNPGNSVHLFAGGSIESLMTLCPPSFILCTSLFVLFLLSKLIYTYRAKLGTALFFVALTLWFFSGRTIGVVFDGRIKTGWFYIPAREFDLCYGSVNCDYILKQTIVTKENLFFIKVKNEKVEYHIYVGPITRAKTINTLNKLII